MNLKRIGLTGAIVVLLFAGTAYASPYWTLHQMRSAINSRDAQAISDHVDFSMLRESIKGEMMAMISTEMDNPDTRSNPFASVGKMMAVALINPVVDTTVSPAGVIAMIESGKTRVPLPGSSESTPQSNDRIDYSLAYRSWDKVAVSAKDADGGNFIFTRHGLWDWKLSAIEFPHSLLAAKARPRR